MITINPNQTVYVILNKHPKFKAVLIDAGFHKLSNPAMVETMGRVTKLTHGMYLRGIDLERLSEIAKKHGFTLSHTL